MARLCIDLPPFSPDYSGIASSFFSLNALTVLHDAAGCSGNYSGYDEPRWYGSRTATMCSALREIDAVLGSDEALVKKVLEGVEELRPEMIVIVSSPVPMVIGFDARGVARELERLTGLPSFGFEATGTKYYDWGLALSFRDQMRRFTGERGKGRGINILGADYIDFPCGIEPIVALLEGNGYKVNAVLPARRIEDLERLSEAELSVVVSLSGLNAAETLERLYGIPFVAGVPVQDGDGFLRRIRGEHVKEKPRQDILVIGEAVTSRSIAEETGGYAASVFSDDRRIRRDGDVFLKSEHEIRRYVNQDRWEMIIADPEIAKLCPGRKALINPHYAISSKLREDYREGLFSLA